MAAAQDFPPGFRFHPTDEELIKYYLLSKVLDSNFTCTAIVEADLNKSEPWHLPGKAKMGEKEWYFYSKRDRKYPTGMRTNRATESGYWKATGKDRQIICSSSPSSVVVVGMKKTLVFYMGRAPKGEKSNWVMHEFRLHSNLSYHYFSDNSQDEWVISRVFQKNPGSAGCSAAPSGGKKRPSSGITNNSAVPDQLISLPFSASLPPLLEPPSAAAYNGSSTTKNERVSCFSTAVAADHCGSSLFDLPPPPYSSLMSALIHDPPASMPSPNHPRFPKHSFGGVSGFPSLTSLQDDLHVPLFDAPPSVHGGDDEMPSYSYLMSQLETQSICPTDLDRMWR